MGSVPEPTTTLRISQLPKEAGKKANFGAIVEGLDLNDISGECQVPDRCQTERT